MSKGAQERVDAGRDLRDGPGDHTPGLITADPTFDSWYRREHPRLIAALVLTTGSLAVAQEAVDEAFARALERWDRVRAMDSPTGWVYRVALNFSHRFARRSALERVVLHRTLPPPDVPPPAGEIWALVATLPRRQREVIVLRHLGGLGEAEIGAVLKISRSTVSTTLRSAHGRLKGLLHDPPSEGGQR